MMDFIAYPKTPRLFREICVTEKIDGSNSQVVIYEASDPQLHALVEHQDFWKVGDSLAIRAGSRNRWLTPKADNFGFLDWVVGHKDELVALGVGRHFGEWWGQGIQRHYDLKEKRFSLFNVARWADGAVTADKWVGGKLITGGVPLPPRPACCGVVPVLYQGPFDTDSIRQIIGDLRAGGSLAVPGWKKPEGVIVFHTAAKKAFKVLLENDGEAKGAE